MTCYEAALEVLKTARHPLTPENGRPKRGSVRWTLRQASTTCLGPGD